MFHKIILFFAPVLFLNFSYLNDNFFQVTLKDLDNHTFSFTDLKKNKATVIVFLLSDCPASQSYTLTLNKISQKFSKSNVSMIGVFPGKYSSDKELLEFRHQYKITFPLLKDPDMILAKKLDAKIAPGCFLIDKNGIDVYHGRIDDWLYAVGKKKPAVTQKNLEDAINAVIKDTPVKIKQTEAIGCILEYGN